MTGTVLERSLKMVAERLYRLRVLRRQALSWVLLLVPAIVLAVTAPRVSDVLPTELLVLLGTTIAGLGFARWKVPAPSAIETAQLIEKHRPELNDAVLTAVQASQRSQGLALMSVMTEWAIAEANQLARGSNWQSVVPGRQMFAWSLMSFLAFCFLVTGVVAAGRWGRADGRSDLPVANSHHLRTSGELAADLMVEPGDIELERGTALTVVARFGRSVPGAVQLILTTDSGSGRFTMDPTVDEGVFAANVSSVESDATYQVSFGDSKAELLGDIENPDFRNKSDVFRITTYVRPQLEQLDALITPPSYTGKDSQLVEDTLRISAVEGSAIELSFRLNKPVAVAELRTKDGVVVPLSVMESELATVTTILEAIDDQEYSVYLEDEFGRTPLLEETVSIKVTRNQRPKIKVTFPGRDTNVSPLQEFFVEAEAIDDFGLVDFGVSWTLSDGTSDEISLVPPAIGDQQAGSIDSIASVAVGKVQMAHTIDMEQLQAEPDQLLSYSFFVEDIAADGMSRRTYSDMMFAEVRRFEDIFRESQQQSGRQQQQQQQQQGGEKTQELMQLQREIMIATWNVRRDLDAGRSRNTATATARENGRVLQESQESALEQLQEVKEEAAADADMLQIVTDVEISMQQALEALTNVTQQPSHKDLSSALAAQQSAIAGLMRLRAKEHEIQRGQQQGQGQGQNSASQQQLRQLELDNDRQRYESERQAQRQQQQDAEQGQQLQILNRLKELARRQQMLNERLKQLESELRAAETDEQEAEIERELKRLREEQREMLRDVDELRETMDQQTAEQQQQNQETREQVDQARDRVQQASQAMDDSRLSEAIAEGTRAEREFDDLQQKFRNQTSGRFSEAMKELRDQTRQMKERQKEIARELAGEPSSDSEMPEGQKAPSLRNTQDREGLQQKVAEQRDSLERVLERARQLVEEAEESEPLLSRRLYDTIRDTRDKKPEQALEAAEVLVSRGLYQQGQQAEQVARQGVDDLAKGIENAADAVLGSEAESLRRAQQEIEDLAEQLASEMTQATGAGGETTADENEQQGQAQQGWNSGPSENGRGTQPADQQSGSRKEGRDSQSQPGDSGTGAQQGERPGMEQSSENSEGAGAGSSEQPGEGKSEAESASEGQGESQSEGRQSGQGQGEGRGKGEGQQPGKGDGSSQGQSAGESQPQPGEGRSSSRGTSSFLMNGGRESNTGAGGTNQGRPLTGDDYADWSNRMREVEEILEDSDLRNQVAQVRDRARSIRAEFRRHGTEPRWDLVKSELLDQMADLQKRIQQELRKMDGGQSMVPIDREPVPEEFDELVRRYYELLGQSREEQE